LDVAADLLVEERLADAFDDLAGGVGADVGQIEFLLQLGQEIAIDPAAQPKQRGDAREEAARSGQPGLDLVEDCFENHGKPQGDCREVRPLRKGWRGAEKSPGLWRSRPGILQRSRKGGERGLSRPRSEKAIRTGALTPPARLA